MQTPPDRPAFLRKRARLFALWLLLVCAGLLARGARAQSPSQMDNRPSTAQQLPLSGRTPDTAGVTVSQHTTNAGGGNTVNTLDSSVSVQGPYSGSVPGAPASPAPMLLTLQQAVQLAMKFNLGAIAQSAAVQQAQGQRRIARSTLLPNLNAAGSEVLEQINLRTQGVETDMFPVSSEFNFFDLRAARLNQSVFDMVQIQNLHSASENVKASLAGVRNARDLIVLAAGGGYLQVIATKARTDAVAAQVLAAQAVYQQAADRFAAGLAPRIDVSRSKVQLQTEQQRLRSLQGDLETQKLRLARVLGLAPGQSFDVTDSYAYAAMDRFTLEDALKQAMEQRSDLKAAQAGVRAAEATVKAAHAEHLPNLKVTADVGAAGLRPTKDVSAVYSVAGTITIPIFEGGRIRGDEDEAGAALKQRKAEFEDVRAQVDQDVRQAFISLRTAADQVQVAQSNVDLSRDTLTQARDRFAAGVADTVEVVQAEQSAVQADDDYITAVYEHNLAKIGLARAMGDAEHILPQLLGTP